MAKHPIRIEIETYRDGSVSATARSGLYAYAMGCGDDRAGAVRDLRAQIRGGQWSAPCPPVRR